MALVVAACSSSTKSSPVDSRQQGTPAAADVTAVTVSGDAGRFTFAVTLRSPDVGCARYANWWEVVRPDGTLVYRRILGHSHVKEQPFTRSGGPANIAADEVVIVRAHMHPTGYGGAAFRGSQQSGFQLASDITAGFASALATSPPQPDGCAF